MEIVNKTISELTPYAQNSRTHTPKQVAQIVASIREFGWTNPILIDERGGIIAGHGRVLAAQKLGMDPVPCIVLSGLTDAQKRAYIIADNQLALNAGWNEEMLRLELSALQDLDFDLGLIGFADEELNLFLGQDGEAGLTDPDETPEVQEEAVSRPGDVWVLGHHRIICGDSTNTNDIGTLFAGGVCLT